MKWSAVVLLALSACVIDGRARADAVRHAGAAGEAVIGAGAENGVPAPVVVPEPSEKAVRYYASGNILWIVSELVGLAIPSLLLFTGLSARMRTLAGRIGRKWFFVIGVYFILYSLVEYGLHFPLTFFAGFIRQHAYGLSNQTLAKWLTDSVISLVIGMVFGCVVLWVPYLLIRRSPRRWWLYSGLLSLPLLVFVMLIEPIWIAPLFNRFEPLKDRQLEGQILALAQRAGIEGGRVFEVDKSVDTKTVNAYVTGIGQTKRIVLWDTLLAKLDTDQVLFVMAHEMGHYVLHHVPLGILAGFIGVLTGLYLIHRFAAMLLNRGKTRFGFDQLSDIASLPLVLLLGSLVSLVLTPIGLAYSRHLEHEADRFALELTQNNHAAATAFVRLQDENLGYPRPGLLYVLWRGNHPSLAERIEFANRYRPWKDQRSEVRGRRSESVPTATLVHTRNR